MSDLDLNDIYVDDNPWEELLKSNNKGQEKLLSSTNSLTNLSKSKISLKSSIKLLSMKYLININVKNAELNFSVYEIPLLSFNVLNFSNDKLLSILYNSVIISFIYKYNFVWLKLYLISLHLPAIK